MGRNGYHYCQLKLSEHCKLPFVATTELVGVNYQFIPNHSSDSSLPLTLFTELHNDTQGDVYASASNSPT